MLHQSAQRIAVRRDHDSSAGLELRRDPCLPIGQHAPYRLLQALGVRNCDAGVAAIAGDIIGSPWLLRRRRDVKRSAPDLHLLRSVPGCGRCLVEAGEPAIMALVQTPVLFDGQPQPPHRLERKVERLDRTRLEAREAEVEVQPLCRHQLAGRFRLNLALPRQVHVPPAREAVLEVPDRLAVADQHERGQGVLQRTLRAERTSLRSAIRRPAGFTRRARGLRSLRPAQTPPGFPHGPRPARSGG